MRSKIHMYTRSLVRRPYLSIIILALVALSVGLTFVNTNKSKRKVSIEQLTLDYIANNLDIKVTAGDTAHTANDLHVTLWNKGSDVISCGKWRIYFYTFSYIHKQKTADFEIRWVNGGLHYMEPIRDQFKGISGGSRYLLTIKGFQSASKTYHFPNWYVASKDFGFTSPRIIESTRGEDLSYVDEFKNSVQWKRNNYDLYNPYTPKERYSMYEKFNLSSIITHGDSLGIIPTPLKVQKNSDQSIWFDNTWVVIQNREARPTDALTSRYLANKLNLKEHFLPPKTGKYIEFNTDSSFVNEQYKLVVSTERNAVTIISNGEAGAFYAAQTFLSLLDTSHKIPEVTVYDRPRFAYRGYMLDVARNFFGVETIKKIIDITTMYKLNKLHLHLTDNDGWRIEIPKIPELTKYGSRRCNYFEEEKCLSPSLGSGPFMEGSGTGYYSVSEFREILRYATERHIQVIPEIDVPGHARAAVQSMVYREQNLEREKDKGRHPSYILSDDVSGIKSVQSWVGNSVNPCMNASYRFFDAILADLQMIYEGIQTLDIVHIGGDEVPKGVWANSTSCKAAFHGTSLQHNIIKKMFILTTADIAHSRGLNVAVWEDGVYNTGLGPYNVKDFKQNDVYVNAWDNKWKSRGADRAIQFSDKGYKVILSMATHLYFDHPYEPDPEERGLHWATRYTDTYKVFGMTPMDVFANADEDINGNKINLTHLCKGACPNFSHPENVVGMQACVWTETIRTEEQLFDMTFPRLVAYAERAWHAAKWEFISDALLREAVKKSNFKQFNDILGRKELQRVEKAGGNYRVPPPGVIMLEREKMFKVNTLYPDHDIMCSYGNGSLWHKVNDVVHIPAWAREINLCAVSSVLKRKSRIVTIKLKNGACVLTYCFYIYVILCFVSVNLFGNLAVY